MNTLMILGGTLGAFLGMFLWRLQKRRKTNNRNKEE